MIRQFLYHRSRIAASTCLTRGKEKNDAPRITERNGTEQNGTIVKSPSQAHARARAHALGDRHVHRRRVADRDVRRHGGEVEPFDARGDRLAHYITRNCITLQSSHSTPAATAWHIILHYIHAYYITVEPLDAHRDRPRELASREQQ